MNERILGQWLRSYQRIWINLFLLAMPVVWWLTRDSHSYVTDELVFIVVIGGINIGLDLAERTRAPPERGRTYTREGWPYPVGDANRPRTAPLSAHPRDWPPPPPDDEGA